MAKKKKQSIQRFRKVNMTDRDRLSVQIIPDKKKKQSKLKCRKRETE